MKNKKLVVLAALLLLIGAGVGTYALYTSTFTGTGEVQVAKWAVELKQGDAAVAEDFDLELALSDNENVADGKIAPGRSATAKLVLDLAGTEVATDYELDLSEVTGLPAGMAITEVKATVDGEEQSLTEDAGKYTGTVELENGAALTEAVTFDVTVTWENDEANNATDTQAGETAETLSIPVTVTAKQHIG